MDDRSYLRTLLTILPLCIGNHSHFARPYVSGYVARRGECGENSTTHCRESADLGFAYGWLVVRQAHGYKIVGHVLTTGVNRPLLTGELNSEFGTYVDASPLDGAEVIAFIPDPQSMSDWNARKIRIDERIGLDPAGEYLFSDLVDEAINGLMTSST